MADGTTTTYGLTKPEVGSSEDTWGEKINGVFDDLDDLLDGTTPVTGIDINSGTIDGVTIGESSAPTVTNIDINGGTIDGVTLGTNSPVTSAVINGGTIDDVTIGATTPAAGSFTSINGGQIGGRRNLIINGAMQVAQRGTSATGKTSSGYYTCDRFRSSTNAEQTETHEQSTDAPEGFSNSYKVTVTTADASIDAGDYAAITQIIEAQNLQHLQYGTSGAKQLTISFWVKASATGTYTVAFYHYDAASNNYISQSYTISSANTWEHKTITLDGNTADAIDNNNGAGLEVYFLYSAGSDWTSGSSNTWGTSANFAVGHTANLVGTLNATFQITGVQLEVGTVATPFEHRSYGEELALCQRYYLSLPDVNYGATYGSGNAMVHYYFPCEMRANPAITVTESGGGTFDSEIIGKWKYSQYRLGDFSIGCTNFEANAEL